MSAAPAHVAINFDKGEIPIKKYGVVANIKCDFLCVSRIGQYKEPRREHVADQIQYLIDWTNQVGFPKTKCVKYEELAKTGGALSMYLAPNIPAKSEKMRALGKYCMWLLLMDDIMDERTNEHPSTTTYDALSKDACVLVSILNGDRNGRGVLPAQASNMSHFKTLCSVMQEVYDGFSSSLPAFGNRDNRRFLVKRTNGFLHGFLWRFGREEQVHTSEATYLFFRRHHSASYCIFEIVALMNDFNWVDSLVDRRHVEFESWVTSYTNALAMSNDILSLRKEMTDDETENLVIHKYMNMDMDMNDAVKACINFTNSEAYEMREYGRRLVSRHPDDPDHKKLVEITGWSLDGHLYWYGFSQRYGHMKLKELHLTDLQYDRVRNLAQRRGRGTHVQAY